MKNNRFNPFEASVSVTCVGNNFTLQGFDAREIRNEAVRGLDFDANGHYLDFLEKHQDDEDLQDLMWENCDMSVEAAYEKAQHEMATQGETEFVRNVISCCEICYSEKCNTIADELDDMSRNLSKRRMR